MSGCRQEHADPSVLRLPAGAAPIGVLCANPGDPRTPFRALVRRAHCEEILPSNTAELTAAGAELRNLFTPSHPEAFTVEMAASKLENTHRMVALVRPPPLKYKGRCRRSHTK